MYKDLQIAINQIEANLTALHDANNSVAENVPMTTQFQLIMKKTVKIQHQSIRKKTSFKNQISDINDSEEIEDPSNEHRMPTTQTCLQSIVLNYPVVVNNNEQSSGNEVYNIAPGENKHPVSFMTDKQCEERAFPVLFPKGRYGYTTEREIKKKSQTVSILH